MSRSRNIKPGFFQNDQLAECEPLARILFAGLWCEADRSGRLLDRPKKIKAACLPYDDCDCDKLLDQLKETGFIARYQVAGVKYIQVIAFDKHQNPHKNEALSELPGVPSEQAPEMHSTSTVQAPIIHEAIGLIPDSLLLIPDSLQHQEPLSASQTDAGGRFAEFWAVYPRDEGKAKAKAAWAKRKLDAIADTIIADVKARKTQHGQWLEGIYPHATTYLNGERWNDAIIPPRNRIPRNGHATNQLSLADRAAAIHANRPREPDDWIDGTATPAHR